VGNEKFTNEQLLEQIATLKQQLSSLRIQYNVLGKIHAFDRENFHDSHRANGAIIQRQAQLIEGLAIEVGTRESLMAPQPSTPVQQLDPTKVAAEPTEKTSALQPIKKAAAVRSVEKTTAVQ
jgi:ABC-type uncharacterized transport system auxiliary subunit